MALGPPIPTPIADLQALTAVTIALKRRVELFDDALTALRAAIATISAGSSTGASYILPVASTVTLGGIKVDGTTVTVTAGVLTASAGVGIEGSNAVPLMDGSAAEGTSARYSRQDHVHPHDTANPAGYQTAGQVAVSIAASWSALGTAMGTTIDAAPAATLPLTGGELVPLGVAGVLKTATAQDVLNIGTIATADITGADSLPISLTTGTTDWTASGTISGRTGDGSGGAASGAISWTTGDAPFGTSGDLSLTTGAGDNTSGAIPIHTGDSTAGSSGAISIVTGNGDATGSIIIATGIADTNPVGSVIIQVGSGGSIPGDIQMLLNGGNLVTAGWPTAAPAVSGALWIDPVTHQVMAAP